MRLTGTYLAGGERKTVLVADDHPMFRDGLARAIEERPDLELMAEASDGREALQKIEELRPDIAVLDVRMPAFDLQAAIDFLRADAQDVTKIVFLSAFGDGDLVYEALAAGAKGFLSKEAGRQEICDALVTIGQGGRVVDPRVEPALLAAIERRSDRGTEPVLTDREVEILQLASQGLSTTEIAARLHLSPETIKSHIKTLFEKLDVSTRTAAVAAALRRGLLE